MAAMDRATIDSPLPVAANTLPDPAGSYSAGGLHLYDGFVMGMLADGAWGCSAEQFVDFYREHLRPRHADLGVGTGYCIDRCEPGPTGRLALIDIRPSCLEYCARRLERFNPETFVRDARAPIQIDARRFDSIGMGGLIHSLPGSMQEKAAVFDALEPIATPGAVVFGYTLVRDGAHRTLRRRMTHGLLNRLRIIDNDADHMADLAAELSRRFTDCSLKLVGNVAFFSATVRSEPIFRHSPGDTI